MSLPAATGKLLRLSWTERALLAEAVVCLALARAAVVAFPFRWIAPLLGESKAETPANAAPGPAPARVAWAIGAAARRSPWRTKCLEQAIAAKAMLRRRGTPSTMYLGVVNKPFAAHAWLRVGAVNVVGGSRVDHYTVVASFADADR